MSEYNPVSVEREILETVNAISEGIIAARDALKMKLDTERAYKRAYAQAFMAHKGPQTEKKVAANIVPEVMSAEDERDAWAVAYEYAKDTNRALSSKLDAIRSVGASVRQAYANAGRGEW
ncbi:hypothetical protein [Mycobacterium phage MS810]|uniref:Uncharacterized protein n=4 Tax=Faithunavirus TaxID=2948705 RepID=A0A291I9V4_9CAUD|nr:hypothetical protein SEA_FAITH1_66 [Mycobacterium phage Faith1]YP_008410941.1 hypothetical protein N848_gp066 [Mycobacterium phage Crossroads]YP_009017290.1 hypothetical protein CL57_gp065 [Mycobacterium phage Rumpelstiltskin]YP_009292580.1 hypothetical protein BI025_gp116 [Mycobacterium phage Gardann]YP_010012904.1 hypothetical protein J4T96_gp066 [Mycobacterium phage Finemlucis]YP_010013034.1 hypothetical protein J4T97_gp065 [Mycobacterium phage GuuelaD]AGK87629.1 hypothetical protein PB